MSGFFTRNGVVHPIRGGGGGGKRKGGAAAVAGVVAAGVIATGGGGLVGAGGGAAGPVAGQGAVGTVRLGGSPAQLRVRKSDAGKAARKGDLDRAWSRMGLRQVRKTARQRASCVASSFGQVREFLARHGCTRLDRLLFTVADPAGNTAVVSVAWVGLRSAGTVRKFVAVMDVQGSGDITPLGGPLVGLADVHFTGLRYGRDLNGASVTIAEAENAPGGQFDHASLDAIAEVAALIP